jgi:hypothetical protein
MGMLPPASAPSRQLGAGAASTPAAAPQGALGAGKPASPPAPANGGPQKHPTEEELLAEFEELERHKG